MLRFIPVLALFLVFLSLGCAPQPPIKTDSGPLPVQVSSPVERQVVDAAFFTGRFDSPNQVELRPRVTGYIMKTPFKEGEQIAKGALLFEIDKRPYKAKLDDAVGQVKLYEAKVRLSIADNLRAKDVAKTPGAISKQELDKYQAQEEESKAALEASKASLEVHKLNLDFCSVTSPIDGIISRYYVTLGNLANQDNTLLTTIVSSDPIYIYFDTDERTVLTMLRQLQTGISRPKSEMVLPVFFGLADEKGFPHKGDLNFVDNRFDTQTGTVTLRAVVQNAPAGNKRSLYNPGMFCRVKFPTRAPRLALLLIDRAVGTDQGLKFVYVVDGSNKVEYRRVTAGALQEDGLRVIEDGIKPGENLIVSGIHLVKPGQTVKPEPIAMPVSGPLGENKAAK
ncbi:MAG: efflux RND transporter periplasmic adaptor subunit [Gemmataceae bacterium]|nr:efflux RND transporter periplasmic adaptor subunit [Gemmataceae bacterium]